MAYLSIQQEDREAACRLYEQGLAICEEIGDFAATTVYLAHLGEEALLRGDYACAVAYKERALTISRALNHPEWEAGNLHALGKLALAQGDYERARPFYLQSMEIQRQLGIKPVILELFKGFALLTLKVSHPVHAVRLWGVVKALQKEAGCTYAPRSRANMTDASPWRETLWGRQLLNPRGRKARRWIGPGR